MNNKLILFAVLHLILIYSCNSETSNKEIKNDKIIVPGERVGKFMINKTLMKEIITDSTDVSYYAEKGLFFGFNKGDELTSITVTSDEYKTDKNISVGDNIEKVLSIYGEYISKEELRLRKGERFSIGTGMDVFNYPGIKFFVDSGEVKVISIISINGSIVSF
jgi:hypothetical protein